MADRTKAPKDKIKEERKPKIIENPKTTMLVRGSSQYSQILKDFMVYIKKLKFPYVVPINKTETNLPPFDPKTHQTLEYFSKSNDASLYILATHSKKRPHNLLFGRCFDYQILDEIEFGLENFVEYYKEIKELNKLLPTLGNKPILLFQGQDWQNNKDLWFCSNYFVDFFRLEEVPAINFEGLDHSLVFSAISDKLIHVDHVVIKKPSPKPAEQPQTSPKPEEQPQPAESSTTTTTATESDKKPEKIEIDEEEAPIPEKKLSSECVVGGQKVKIETANEIEVVKIASFDLKLGRTQKASNEMRKKSLEKPQELLRSKEANANVGVNALQEKQGRVFVKQQPISQIALRRFKALSKPQRGPKAQKPSVGADDE